jgi:hypothetical protein
MTNWAELTEKCCWWCELPIAGRTHLPGCPAGAGCQTGANRTEEDNCPHNGLFALNPPKGAIYPNAAYMDWLDSTVRCHDCGQDVPIHQL